MSQRNSIDLVEVIEVLFNESQKAKLTDWLTAQIKEYTNSQLLRKVIIASAEWLIKSLKSRVGDTAKDKLASELESWINSNSNRGKCAKWLVERLWEFINKEAQATKKALSNLNMVLDNHEQIVNAPKEVALTAKLFLNLNDVKKELANYETNVLEALENIYPSFPVQTWDEYFMPEEENDPKSLLLYTQLRGRDNEHKRLTEFLVKDSQPIFILSGPAGQGKTKLALEVCKTAEQQLGWSTYFAVRGHISSPWTQFKTFEKTLFVIDYALTHPVRDSLVDYVRNYRPGWKLLLLERHEFAEELMHRRLAAKGMDQSPTSLFATRKPYTLEPLTPENELLLFKDFSNGAIPPSDVRKLTMGNPLLTIYAGQSCRADKQIDFAKMSKARLLRGRWDYLYKCLEKETEEHTDYTLRLLLIACLVHGLSSKDKLWLNLIGEDLGIPLKGVGWNILLKKARAALFNQIESKNDGRTLHLKIEPDLLSAAFLARSCLEEHSIYKEDLIDYIDLLLPYRASDIALTLSLAMQDLPPKEAATISQLAQYAANILWSKPPSIEGAENLDALNMFTLTSNNPKQLKNDVEKNILPWIALMDLKEEHIETLMLITSRSGSHKQQNVILPRIAAHPSFKGYPAIRFCKTFLQVRNGDELSLQLLNMIKQSEDSTPFILALKIQYLGCITSIKKLKDHSNNLFPALLLPPALLAAVQRTRNIALIKTLLAHLADIIVQYSSLELHEFYAGELQNTITTTCEQHYELTKELLNTLKVLVNKHDEPNLRVYYANALFNTVYKGDKKDSARTEELLHSLKKLTEKHDEPVLRNRYARALYNEFNKITEQNLERAKQLLHSLKELAEKYDELELQKRYAYAVTNVIAKTQDTNMHEELIEQFVRITKKNNEAPLRIDYANILYNAFYKAAEQKIDRSEDLLCALQELANQYNEPEVHDKYALALTIAIEEANAQRATLLLRTLEKLTQKYDEPSLVKYYAEALTGTIKKVSGKRTKDLLRTLKELIKKHNDPELRGHYADALSSEINKASKKRAKHLLHTFKNFVQQYDEKELTEKYNMTLAIKILTSNIKDPTIFDKDIHTRDKPVPTFFID